MIVSSEAPAIVVAIDRPNQLIESDVLYEDKPCRVRAVHLEEEGGLHRTLILFEPLRAGAAQAIA